ncbi:hypothetical protein [Lewinella sp. W8]|uniref:hypothetical protein n=1 Tax=Lewinella sp. W8 TaxID=2528208 RepID=UPI001068AA38|nr:hypothetical protein [Lewinella sp. W8]MTB53971.1 hypothetical protein [Lewinella sp. W8]
MKLIQYPLLLLLAAFCFACGGNDEATVEEDNMFSNAAEAMKSLTESNAGNERPALEKEALKEMAPETLLGLPRKSRDVQKVGAGGFELSTLEADYGEDGNQKSLSLVISDGMGAKTMGLGAALEMVTVDREEGTKTTETVRIDGRKAVREFDTANGNGSLSVVFDQTVVVINGRGLSSIDELEQAYNELDFSIL